MDSYDFLPILHSYKKFQEFLNMKLSKMCKVKSSSQFCLKLVHEKVLIALCALEEFSNILKNPHKLVKLKTLCSP